MAKNTQLRDYTVVRTVKETYKVQALTRHEAVKEARAKGRLISPDTVTVVSENAHWDRTFELPPGYAAIALNFKNPSE